MRGFIEFAFNYPKAVADAQNYFKIFFDFNFHVFESKYDDPIEFGWEIDGAIFRDDGDCHGFSVAVWITTKDLQDKAQTEAVWERAVSFLSKFLAERPALTMPMIYPPPTLNT